MTWLIVLVVLFGIKEIIFVRKVRATRKQREMLIQYEAQKQAEQRAAARAAQWSGSSRNGISVKLGGPNGQIVYFVDGNNVHEGMSSVGRVVYYINGNDIHEGFGTVSRVAYYIDGNNIHEGIGTVGRVVYYIDGNYIRDAISGQIVYYLEY